jgi:uncharacterized protein
MESKTHPFKNSQIIVLGLCIAIATIVSSVILSQGFIQVKRLSTEVISVTGSAEKRIVSDFIVWRARFSRRDVEMTTAYAKLKEDLKTIREYLIAQGIAENEIVFTQVYTEVLYMKNERGMESNVVEGYRLSQSLEIGSHDVLKISEVSRRSTELINQEIEFISEAPQYLYTKLSDLKLEMLSEATQNAVKRAEQMAQATSGKIGIMRSAKMGVFQITPISSVDVSDWGMNDTTSFEKKVMAVVKADFSIRA